MTRLPEFDFDDIAQLLYEYLCDNFPDELNSLSTHTMLEEVTDVEIDSKVVSGETITINGKGWIEVELNYGSESDRWSGDGDSQSDSFKFTFQATISDKIITYASFEFDLDHFYE